MLFTFHTYSSSSSMSCRKCLYPLSIHFESLQIREHLLLHAPQNYNWICSDATEYQLCPANPPVCSVHVRLISLPAETVSLDCAALNVLDLRLAVPVSSNQTNRNHRVPPNTSHSLHVRLMLGQRRRRWPNIQRTWI